MPRRFAAWQRRVVGAIECYRTAALGGHMERCDAFGRLALCDLLLRGG